MNGAKQPDFVEFQEEQNDVSMSQLESTISFNQVRDEFDLQNINRKKSHAMKKLKKNYTPNQIQQIKSLKTIGSFPLSVYLINLLRQPQIENHQFSQKFLEKFRLSLQSLNVQNQNQEIQAYIIYLHLVLAQVQNFKDLQHQLAFKEQINHINHDIWNTTNILNSFCILENLKSLEGVKVKPQNINEQTGFFFDLVEQDEVCLVFENRMKISKNLTDIALNSRGHWDIYFGPFLLEKFETGVVFRYLFVEQCETQMLENYSKIFTQLSREYAASKKVFSQKWYQQQIEKIVKDQFSINEIQHLVISGIKNQNLEKLLIGLIGWKQQSDRAIKLLNCYYDCNDWNLNDTSRPTICQCGQNFHINYLIENSRYRQKLVICLKAPCFNSKYNGYCFSFHKPKLNEYTVDEISYLWVQNTFGKFKKTGFYDWILYFANTDGKQPVVKIIDIRQNKKMGSQLFSKNVLNMKNVKGRYIIHPQNSRQMQIHELYLDAINSDEGHFKAPSFEKATSDLAFLKNNGVDTVYISGIFERDNGQFQQGFKRPQASPVAVTNRTRISTLLGGQNQFKKLLAYAKKSNIKIIIDFSTRVSSSRMSKKYQHLKLMYIDDKGKKNFFYGSEGKAINYEQTAILNYRKKQAWDLLLDEIVYLIEKFQIDGIHLDNGHICPQLYEIDKEELKRFEDGKLIYNHEQIFEGQIINIRKKAGYWTSKVSLTYPNPFFVFLTTQIWQKYPKFTFISETLETENSINMVNAIESGFIPRLFKMPKALSQIVGTHLHQNGSLSSVPKKSVTKLAKWYEETKRILPRNSILIQSTTNHVYPYPALIFKKATWAVVDLFFFLPEIPMTFGIEHFGRAYRTKALNIYIENQSASTKIQPESIPHLMKKTTSYTMANSTFFEQEPQIKKKQKISVLSNITIRDPSQVKTLQAQFRKEVGPQFGFDLAEIHKHYQHRRELRHKLPLLCAYRMIPLSAQHLYGLHTNVISFAKYDEEQILLISTNFNETAVDMHYNLTPLRSLFHNSVRCDLIVKLEDILNPKRFVQEYYIASELIEAKIEDHIKAYSSSIWKLQIMEATPQLLKKSFKCSQKRIKERISRNPPQWIYSSIFTNELSRLIGESKKLNPFINGLNTLYNEFILPDNLNFNLVISKTHELFVHKVKLQKLFGIFKLLQTNQNKPYFQKLQPTLRKHVENLLKDNQLGPIAFVTPEIGAWSSVGGLGVMVDQLSKELVKLGEKVYIVTPYYQYNKKRQTGYLAKDGFIYERNIKVYAAHFEHQFGIHRGNYHGVNYIWFHNPDLFSRPYDGQGAMFVTKQMVFFALAALESFCQLQIFPSIVVTNDWMCGFVSAYVKVQKYKQVFNGTRFMHICHNLDPLYEGRLYPKYEEGDLNWLVQLPREWYVQHRNNKMIINPSRCALQSCDNWSTVSHSYKVDLLKSSPLAQVLWKHPHPFSFPNGVRKDQRLSIIHAKTPGTHAQCKKLLQQKYFKMENLNNDMPLFAFIGRVTKQKGVHLIIDAVQQLLFETQFKIQFLIGGPSDSKGQYGKYCADRMKYLTYKYPLCVWSDPDAFFTDGALVNMGSDFAMMPSQFEPGGIVQHEFFCGGTPVVAFRTGGLKDTVFQYDPKSKKGNGFNFMSYEVQDFKRCMRRAINCYKNKEAYEKLRQNAFQSVVEESDVARGWNSEFYRMQNKIYIDWDRVENQIKTFTEAKQEASEEQIEVLKFQKGQYWKKTWQIKRGFKEVLKGASRLEVKTHAFCYQTDKIPRPKQVLITGTWDNWKQAKKMNFQKIHKNWKITLKLKPGTYHYKYIADGQWTLTKEEEYETDINGIQNHIVSIE